MTPTIGSYILPNINIVCYNFLALHNPGQNRSKPVKIRLQVLGSDIMHGNAYQLIKSLPRTTYVRTSGSSLLIQGQQSYKTLDLRQAAGNLKLC